VVPTLCALAGEIGRTDFPKFRAVVVSLGRLRDPAAADVLAMLLQGSGTDPGLKELLTACALYRCGDKDGRARKMLESFATGQRGTYARLAWQVLQSQG
jgi:hypothetical protein